MPAEAPITLALVEDDRAIRETLIDLLSLDPSIRLIGHCADGTAALATLPDLDPQVVLMDIGLPGADGIRCVRELVPRMPGTQFLMYTVHDADDRVFEALKAGADGYLLKNSSAQQIVEAVHELVAGGAPMSTSVARRVIAHFQGLREPLQSPVEPLSQREQTVLELLAKGMLNKEIAEHLGISPNTVGQHVHRIYRKLHVQTRIEAVNKYFGK